MDMKLATFLFASSLFIANGSVCDVDELRQCSVTMDSSECCKPITDPLSKMETGFVTGKRLLVSQPYR